MARTSISRELPAVCNTGQRQIPQEHRSTPQLPWPTPPPTPVNTLATPGQHCTGHGRSSCDLVPTFDSSANTRLDFSERQVWGDLRSSSRRMAVRYDQWGLTIRSHYATTQH